MKTEILKSTKKNIKKIVDIIRDGGVVGYQFMDWVQTLLIMKQSKIFLC